MNAGQVIAGKYRIEGVLGRGGLGIVYRAVQLGVDREVALKMMLPHVLASGDGRARFRREAELAKRLEHPNTVRLYDFGEAEDGTPFIVWELLKGRSLDAVLAAEGALAPERVAHVARQTLKSLMEAHGLGVVHRDIKPSNLFLCEFSGERDFVKVLDFGIAKAADASEITRGRAIGTPAYMSPEQVRGEEVTATGDLYALGLVLAEAVSGLLVYGQGDAVEVALAQRSAEPPPLPRAALDSPLGEAIVRATYKDAARRFQSAEDMLAAIEIAIPATTRGGERSLPLPAIRVFAPDLGSAPTVVAANTAVMARRNAKLGAAAALVGALSIATLFVVLGRRRSGSLPVPVATAEVTARSSPRTAPSARPRLQPLRLAKITPDLLRQRLERLGWRVVAESETAPSVIRTASLSISRDNVRVQLFLYRCANESVAESLIRTSSVPIIRDGTVVLATGSIGIGRQVFEELGY